MLCCNADTALEALHVRLRPLAPSRFLSAPRSCKACLHTRTPSRAEAMPNFDVSHAQRTVRVQNAAWLAEHPEVQAAMTQAMEHVLRTKPENPVAELAQWFAAQPEARGAGQANGAGAPSTE